MTAKRIPLGPAWWGNILYQAIRREVYRGVAGVIAPVARHADALFHHSGAQTDPLFDLIPCGQKTRLTASREYAGHDASDAQRHVIVLNGTFNSCLDIQGLLGDLRMRLRRGDRVLAVLYNPYLRGLYVLADRLGFRQGPEAVTFVTAVDLYALTRLAGYEVVSRRTAANFPLRLLGLGRLVDRALRLLPFVRRLALVEVAVLRPILPDAVPRSLSVIVPARNERGNIRAVVDRLPRLPGVPMELVFVEGHSSDGTWEEIQRVADEGAEGVTIRAYQQTGAGKADAVRLGFSRATGEVLTILDADMTMPPEMLGRFYEAYRGGLGDFINGNRLVYPMEGHAMRFLNRLGNIFFAKALSYVLDVRLGDTLCGTKLLSKADYARFVQWRSEFGDFDPFGDFELLFPAAELGLGAVDLPVHYRARTYGETNISRFRHGWMLARMTWIGFKRIKLGLGKRGPRSGGPTG